MVDYLYNDLGRVFEELRHNDGEDSSTFFNYDVLSNVTEIIAPVGNDTDFQFDSNGRQVAEVITVDDEDLVRSRHYDPFGNLVQSIDRNGRTIQYAYDNVGHRTAETWYETDHLARTNIPNPISPWSDLVKDHCATFAFDVLGQLDFAQDFKRCCTSTGLNSSYDISYDSGQRVNWVVQELGVLPNRSFSFEYTHDTLGRTTSGKLWEDASEVLSTNYGYSEVDQPGEISESGAYARAKNINFEWGAQLLFGIRRYESGQTMYPETTTQYTYLADGRLDVIKHYQADSQTPFDTLNIDHDYKGLIGSTIWPRESAASAKALASRFRFRRSSTASNIGQPLSETRMSVASLVLLF